ncbi:hypothetical protein, partial [Paracidovorax wautersii]
PTEEQTQAYAERTKAFLGLTGFDSMVARLPHGGVSSHTFHPDCLVVPTLGACFTVVELEDLTIGIAVPKEHKAWINVFPFDFVAVSSKEVFFVSKSFTWLNSEMPATGISLGAMCESELLAKLCNQKVVQFYAAANVADIQEVTLIRPGAPVPVFHTLDSTPLFKTRSTYEARERAENVTESDHIRSHFMG